MTNKVDQLPSEHGNHMVMLRLSQAFVDDNSPNSLPHQLLKSLNLPANSKDAALINKLTSGNLPISKENEQEMVRILEAQKIRD